MMDIEKLIERLEQYSEDLIAYKLGCNFADACTNAATALATLQAEVEFWKYKCKESVSHTSELDIALHDTETENEKLRAELEQVKQERDAVLNAFRGFIQLGHLCEYCAETLKDDPACSACEKWSKFQWRGAAEE